MSLEDEQEKRKARRAEFRDPKKHFVRANGWLPIMERYARIRQRRTKYLTLCAKGAIDVRYFARKGHLYRNAEANLYPSLTFVEGDPEDYAVISESLGRVALGVRARFEEVILDSLHESHSDFVGTFPHDVVNLDFCGDVVSRSDEHPYGTTLQSIVRVIELQRRAGSDGWHLFLTFRAQTSTASPQARDEIIQILESNLEDPALAARYQPRPAPQTLATQSYEEFLRLGICKIAAHAAAQNGYELTLDSSFKYSRHHANGYHIVKIVCGFQSRVPPGAIPNAARSQTIYEGAVRRVFDSEATDVDVAVRGLENDIETDLAPVLNELKERGIVE